MSKQKSSDRFRFSAASILLTALILLVPAVRGQDGDASLYLLTVMVPAVMFLCETMLSRMFSMDRMIMALVLWLCAAGIAALALSDAGAALAHSLRCCAALVALLAGGIMVRSLSPSLLTSACTSFLGLLLLSGRLFSSAAQNLPLTEAALALLLIAFAALLSRQGPVSALLLGAAALVLLQLSGDTANAALWALTVLLLIFAADGRLVVVLPALAVMLLLFFVFPFPDPIRDESSLNTLLSAGIIGTDMLPEGFTAMDAESLFLPLAGHYGLIFAGLTALLFLPLSLRGSAVAAFARTRFHAVIAMGGTLLLALRALSALLAVFGFLPLSGFRLPFLTVSLPDLCAELFLAGLLCGISGRNDADLAEDAHLAMLAK